MPATHPDMCLLRVRRSQLLQDSLQAHTLAPTQVSSPRWPLQELARQRTDDLRKPLQAPTAAACSGGQPLHRH